jgi:uncharacterized protein (TIGR02145 family)
MKNFIFLFSFIFALSSQLMAQTIMNIHQSNGTVLQIPLNTIDSITYTNPNPGNLATITTTAIGNITASSASSGGNISSSGGSLVTQRGVCWSTSPNPTTANNVTTNGSGTGSFTSTLTGLTANTTYYVRAYAINSAGTAYGNQLSFTAASGGSGIVSNPGPGVTYNGYNYPTIILGNGQEWMAHNLRTTQYSDGTTIPLVTDSSQWQANTFGVVTSLPMMCWYNNDQATYTANNFGALYNWYAVNPLTNGNKNVCPTGWHVPTDSEWNLLVKYIDPQADTISVGGNQSAIAGGKMKSTGTQYWQSPNQDATNESGFSGLPGGIRYIDGRFAFVGEYGPWWSSTEYDTDVVWDRRLGYSTGNVARNVSVKEEGLSVRCLRD